MMILCSLDCLVINFSYSSEKKKDGKVATFHCSFLSNLTLMDVTAIGTKGTLTLHFMTLSCLLKKRRPLFLQVQSQRFL